MTKLLPLDRRKKQSIPERKTFSDDKSNEEDEEAEKEEHIVIPRSKRKVQADAPKAKRHKPNPKQIPKQQEPRQIPDSELPKSDPGLHSLRQDLLLAGLQTDSSQNNRSPLQFLVEDNARRAYCIYVTSKYCTSTP